MKTVLSGIRPTGDLHLGNYFGAEKACINAQKKTVQDVREILGFRRIHF